MPAPSDPNEIRPVELSELRAAARDAPRVRPMPLPQSPGAAPAVAEAPKKKRLGLAIPGGIMAAGALLVAAWLIYERRGIDDQGQTDRRSSQVASRDQQAEV